MKTLDALLDTFALVASTAPEARNMHLSLHGDEAVAAVRAWAQRRAIALPPPVERSDRVSSMRWTVDRVTFDGGASIDAYSDWRPIEAAPSHTERQAIPVIAESTGAQP